MFLGSLHPLGGNSPHTSFNLGPLSSDHFARAGGGENCELERPCRNAVLLAEPLHEIWKLAERHRLMMLHPPACSVHRKRLAVPHPLGDTLDPLLYPTSGLRLLRPY